MEPPKETVSGESVKLLGPKPRVSKKSNAPNSVTTRAAAKIKAKALISCRKAPKAEEKASKASEGEVGKAPKEAERESPLVAEANSSRAFEAKEVPQALSPTRPPGGAGEQLPQLPVVKREEQMAAVPSVLNPLPSKSCGEEPAPKRARINPEATFTPTAAGLRQKKAQGEPEMSPEMRLIISKAIAQGIAAAIEQNQQAAPPPVPANASHQGQPTAPDNPKAAPDNPKDVPVLPGPRSPASSMPVRESPSDDEENKELGVPEDEGATPKDPLDLAGPLFQPALFKTLLQRAKATARLGAGAAASDPALDVSDPDKEPAVDSEMIPAPKLFLDVVQRPWAKPGTFLAVNMNERRFYNVGSDVRSALEIPVTDGPVVALASSAIVFNNAEDALKPGNKKAELTLRKAHEMAAWAVKSAMAASFFNRISLLWLKEMQARIPATDLRTHQDLNNLVAAAEFSADATVSTAKFASRAIASSVTARRLLWLRPWKATMKLKWKLASAPFKGDRLFGEALEPMLTETKDKKKILPPMAGPAEQRAVPTVQKPAFKAADTAQNFSQPQKAPFQKQDGQSNKPGYRDQNRQQFQPKQPFQGNGSRPVQGSSRDLQRKATRWGPSPPSSMGGNNQRWNVEATGGPQHRPTRPRSQFSHDTREGLYSLPQDKRSPHRSCSPTPVRQSSYHSSDSRPKKPQSSGIQENQNADRLVYAKERSGRQRPDVNRSQGSIPTHPYIPDSPASPPLLLCEPSLPGQNLPVRSVFSTPNIHEETNYALGSAQDYPYSRQALPARPVDPILLPSRAQREPTLHELALSESRILNQLRQDLLLSFQQESTPRSVYRDDVMHNLPVPGQHQSSGELDPVRPNSASGHHHTTGRHDCPLHGHRSLGTSACQGCTPEIRQEQFNYRSSAPIRSSPGVDVTSRNQGMHIQGSEPSQSRYERQFLRPEREHYGDPHDIRPEITGDDRRAYGGHTKQQQPARRSPPSPRRVPEHHLRPSRTSPTRRHSQQDPYQAPREYPSQVPYVRSQALGRTASSAYVRRT